MGWFSSGETSATSTVITPTSTSAGQGSISGAGDGAVGMGNATVLGRQSKQDNSVKTSNSGNSTVKGNVIYNYAPPGGASPPAINVTVPGSGSGGGLADVGNFIAAVRNSSPAATAADTTGLASTVQGWLANPSFKIGLAVAFPVVALVLYLIFRRKKS